ncbi:hypothetical protein HGRIS_014796 [Hohenbuehelia grisea]|uniref:Uncharacterized protein n=1 Tax=Hohenbuehelia grisea TaxID=104357 RepID=A0ABR3IQR8_9AGAR
MAQSASPPSTRPGIHYRAMSNDSMKSLTSMGYMTSVPTSPSVIMTTYPGSESAHHANSASVHSLPYLPMHTAQSSPSPPLTTPSPDLLMSNPQNIINPFPYSPPRGSSSDEKHSRQGSRVLVYDDPTLPPPRAQTIDSFDQASLIAPSRRRFNPPAYSPPHVRQTSGLAHEYTPSYAEANIGRREGHRPYEKGSIDSQHSLETAVTTPPAVLQHLRGHSQETATTPGHGHSVSAGSISAIDEIVSPLGFDVTGTGTGTGTLEGRTVVTGESRMLQTAQPQVQSAGPRRLPVPR